MRTQQIVAAPALALLLNLAAVAETYRDPHQRFEISTPAGWMAEPFGEGVKLSIGSAYCLVMEGQAETPDTLVKQLVRQFAGQWSGLQELKQGTVTVSGQQAPFSFNSGVNPKGIPSFMKVLAVTQGRTFALVESAPQKEFLSVKAGFDQIEQSFRISAGQYGQAPAYGQQKYGQQSHPLQPAYPQTAQAGGDGYGSQQQPAHMPAVGGPFVGIAIDERQSVRGALVGALAPGGPAEKAGVRPGDLIVGINRRPITSGLSMRAAVAGCKPNDMLDFNIVRDGQQFVVRVRVGVFNGQ